MFSAQQTSKYLQWQVKLNPSEAHLLDYNTCLLPLLTIWTVTGIYKGKIGRSTLVMAFESWKT